MYEQPLVEQEIKQNAREELKRFGIETNAENIAMVDRSMSSKQTSEKYSHLFDMTKGLLAGDEVDEALLHAKMKELSIDSIVHAEGPTLWDHVSYGFEQIDSMDLEERKKKFFEIVFLYHDIGKTDSEILKVNSAKNEDSFASTKSKYKMSFVGHADFEKMVDGTEEIVRQSFIANGFTEDEADRGIWLIKYHMAEALVDPKSKLPRVAEIYNESGSENYHDLIALLRLDGVSTAHYDIEKGFTPNQKKTGINVDKQLENISIYNQVAGLFDNMTDQKKKIRIEGVYKAFFNNISNSEDIDPERIDHLKAQIKKIIKSNERIQIPSELKPLSRVLRDKTASVAREWETILSKKGNETEIDDILNRQLDLTPDQIQAILSVLNS